jgi:hypothetical protein
MTFGSDCAGARSAAESFAAVDRVRVRRATTRAVGVPSEWLTTTDSSYGVVAVS